MKQLLQNLGLGLSVALFWALFLLFQGYVLYFSYEMVTGFLKLLGVL